MGFGVWGCESLSVICWVLGVRECFFLSMPDDICLPCNNLSNNPDPYRRARHANRTLALNIGHIHGYDCAAIKLPDLTNSSWFCLRGLLGSLVSNLQLHVQIAGLEDCKEGCRVARVWAGNVRLGVLWICGDAEG